MRTFEMAVPSESRTIPFAVTNGPNTRAANINENNKHWLPAAGLHEIPLFDGGGGEALHGAGDGLAGFGDDLRVVEVSGGDDDGAGAGDGLFALLGVVLDVEGSGALLHEDAGAYEDGLGTQ